MYDVEWLSLEADEWYVKYFRRLIICFQFSCNFNTAWYQVYQNHTAIDKPISIFR